MSIVGLFEIHIIVRPQDQFHLFAYCADNKNASGYINMRATCAQTLYGDEPIQPMITVWYKGNQDEAKAKAQELAQGISERGTVVRRVKVESVLCNTGVPEELTESKEEAEEKSKQYYEFHFKVAVETSQDWARLEGLCREHDAHLFFNPYSQSHRFIPVVTLRKWKGSRAQALEDLEKLTQYLVEKDFVMLGGIEKEYSVFDSNEDMDKGWLFA